MFPALTHSTLVDRDNRLQTYINSSKNNKKDANMLNPHRWTHLAKQSFQVVFYTEKTVFNDRVLK